MERFKDMINIRNISRQHLVSLVGQDYLVPAFLLVNFAQPIPDQPHGQDQSHRHHFQRHNGSNLPRYLLESR